MNEEQAKALVQPMMDGCIIVDVEDFDELYAIYFVNNEYYESKDLNDLKIGAGPIFVEKETGNIFSIGSGVSAQFYVKAYRECGSVYGRPSSSVLMNELINNDNPKACIVELKHISGKTMAEAKNIYSDLVNGNIVKLDFDSEDDAEKAIEKLSLIWIYAKLIWC
jgi:hypothetical protein